MTWTVSFQYSPPHPGGGVVNDIRGGTWSLTASRGTLFGNVTGGEADRNTAGTEATAVVNLTILGGTGKLAGATGTAQFSGVLSHETLIPTMSGVLVLNSTK